MFVFFSLHTNCIFAGNCRQLFSTSAVVLRRTPNPFLYKLGKDGLPKERLPPSPTGRKKIPFDKRYPISTKDVAPTKWGGSRTLVEKIGRDTSRFPHPPGYYDEKGQFHLIEEMVPKLVVPDLKDFKLKPYVSYRVKEVVEPKLTAKDLFKKTYAVKAIEKFKNLK